MGANLIQHATCKNKIASDINPYVIAFFKRLQEEGTDWLPKSRDEFTKEDYKYMQAHKEEFDMALLGHVGYNLSYGGKWFGGFRADKVGKRDYIAEAYRGACKQLELIGDVKFFCRSYDEWEIPENAVVYCNIPYKDMTRYNAVNNFDHGRFYSWCREQASRGVKVYVSEYNMPADFKVVWEQEIRQQIKKNDNSTLVTERLFTL